MATKASAKAKPATRLRVLRTERLSPGMIRIVAGGAGLAQFTPTGFTDSYVKVVFPAAGVTYPEPFDMRRIRAEYPAEQQPRTRTFTVRYFDEAASELAIDLVDHGGEGLAAPWAAALVRGDEFTVLGPGGGYAPDPAADWHLLVGDESAMPAIAVSLESMPADARGHVFLEVGDERDQQSLRTPTKVSLHWMRRSAGDDTAQAVRELDFPTGRIHAFVHGEADLVRAVRRHLLNERGVARDRLSVSGYWRRGRTDERWREEKAAEKAAQKPRETSREKSGYRAGG